MTRRMLVGAAAMTLLWVVAGVAVAAGPGSDSFAGATVLTGLPESASQSVVTATTEVDEDTVTCATISHTVWFSYTPAFNSVLVADTVGSSFDTMLNVWTGSWPFDEATELVACNDDINLGGGDLDSRVQFNAAAGTTYWFQVGGWFNNAGDLIFHVAALSEEVPEIHMTLCFGLPASIVGSAGPDTLEGTASADVIVGLGGDDTIYGNGGDDLICGNAGADLLIGGAGNDRIRGGPGNDTLRGTLGDDRLGGGDGFDRGNGGRGADVCLAEATHACEH